MSETQVQEVHAHVCMYCAKEKKKSIWVHGNENAGIIGTHVCPECGHIEWRKVILENGKLPQQGQPQKVVSYETLLGYIVLAVAISLLGYGAYLYVVKSKKKEIAIE